MRVYPRTNEIFHDASLLDAEQDRLFADGWILVGTADQVPGPDTHFVYDAQGRSLLITRDEQGQLHGFVNACTHRGTRLCSKAGGGKLQCPYHGWVFANDGRLLGATRRSGLPTFDDTEYGLRPISVDQVGGFLFAHGQRVPAIGLREFLGDMATNLERVSESLGTFLFELRLPIEGNWKLAVSGGLEDYHAPFVHKQATSRVRIGENATTLAEHGHSWFQLDAPVPRALRVLLHFLMGAAPRPVLESHCVFPNITVVTIWSFVQVSNWIPVAPGRTLRVVRFFAKTPRPGRFSPRRLLIPLLARLARRRSSKIWIEDQWIIGEAQLGTRAAATMLRGPAHAQEARVEHLLAEVARRLGYRYRDDAAGEAEGREAKVG
ncbi:MAG: aromatic ring-hydroxylating dioxygenase subunit alpha [Pseudomonadota bacterium]|nr:aromatic ring-hydroxylating dioxygenase subunit alpha [Pseudomonadota bacterium]